MSLVRRIVVVSKKPQIHAVARELAHEVFAADDLAEARDIVATVSPSLVVFEGVFAPAHVQACLGGVETDVQRPPLAIVIPARDSPFADSEYEQAGALVCPRGEENGGRLRDLVAATLETAQHQAAERNDPVFFQDEIAAAVKMAGRSEAIARTLQMIKLVAASRCNPVLIVGDTGTGKEVAAQAVHRLRHPNDPFVAVNCAALTANLLESELFGHVKGSFTSADRDKTGLLEMAGSGTIFLDEISEMPLELQAKLLRVLQERVFRKVGGLKDVECKATIIASSNRDLKKEVREKRFRQDLYYRLNICPIAMAPLHSPERRQDIQLLAQYFLQTSSICSHRPTPVTAITKLALEALCRHDWPGNVRELRNVIERAIVFETTDKIGMSSIIIDPIENRESARHTPEGHMRDFSLEKAERELIARALHETGWQKTQAAALLGITRATLYAKVKQYNLHKDKGGEDELEVTASPAEALPVAVD
ncbi:MAG: sigma-54-dependent Fis family transcriptional regulator [Phycisphaerae bacterium]|nr:sigma-54-dependent Fis family transcriptional regulator [Phycisphaerae bacterium]